MKNKITINSFVLHIIAYILMLCDHISAKLDNIYLTYFGRLAFPMFAFLLVEGFFHTNNKRRYIIRLLILAILSEIPFNLMISGNIYFPNSQNVIWTLLLSLLTITLISKITEKKDIYNTVILSSIIVWISFIIATLFMFDYYFYGVLTVLIFYIFHEKRIINYFFQLICLFLINTILIKGGYTLFSLGSIKITSQSFAIFSLLLIWLYNGKQGPYNKLIKICFYLFYPLHMLILYLL